MKLNTTAYLRLALLLFLSTISSYSIAQHGMRVGNSHRQKTHSLSMKNFLRFLLILCITTPSLLFAQDVPQKMNYQAVARTADGQIIANQEVGLRIAIVSIDNMDRPVYAEQHTMVTNKLGLINIHIGDGDAIEGGMSIIDWGASAHYLKLFLDVDNSGDFVEMGTSQLLTVPYAFYAERSGSSAGDNGRDHPDNWSKSGNAATTAGTDFLGTTDAQDLVFKTNGVEAGRFNQTGQLALPTGSDITFGGVNALNMDGVRNIHIGRNAGAVSTGSQNSFIGSSAGLSNTTGYDNAFIGPGAGSNNTIGYRNVFIGFSTGKSNLSGYRNTFIGGQAGFANTTGIGNNAIGFRAGYGNTTGNRNTFIGDYAGQSNTTGSFNTYIGKEADGAEDLTNATAIGAGAQVDIDNAVVLGNNANVGIGTSSPQSKLHVEGAIRMVDGNQAVGHIPVSDANGKMVWTDPNTIGTVGPTGPQGPTGAAGADGADGADGLSAYEVAVNNGFVGTEAAWLTSLEGPQGPTGAFETLADADNDTKIQVEESTDEDIIRFDVNGTERFSMKSDGIGNARMDIYSTQNNIFLGKNAGLNADDFRVKRNVVVGNDAGVSLIAGEESNFIGFQAGYSTTGGTNNNFIGAYAGNSHVNGSANNFIGGKAGYSNVDGETNVFIGSRSGYSNVSGWSNIFIGHNSGYNELGSGRLYIENSNSSSPLIYGEFDNDLLRINGTLNVNNAFSFPIVDGTNGQALLTDGSGNLSWSYINYSIKDADNDTKIQVEESADEDIIRFDLAGIERMTLKESVSVSADPIAVINFPNNFSNVVIGENAGLNTARIGGTIGHGNSFIGAEAGYFNEGGYYNVFNGYQAGRGTVNTSPTYNVISGYQAGYSIGNGAYNTFIGSQAGNATTAGSRNIFLGYQAGYSETGSDKLYIENSNSSSPLIYGEFLNDLVRINGTLNINNAFSFPTVDGTNGQALLTDGSGNLSWTSLTDNDAQDLSLSGNILSLTNDATTVDLSSYLDNTDEQSISFSSNTLSLTNGGSVDLSGYLDADNLGNHSATQTLQLNSQNLTFTDVQNSNAQVILRADDQTTGSKGLVIRAMADPAGNPILNLAKQDGSIVFDVKDNGDVKALGKLEAVGIKLPSAFDPDAAYVGTTGNSISFAHSGSSEDFLGYKDNNFYFRDSPGGGDATQPSVYAQGFPTYSSRRWKHNIEDLGDALSVIKQLRGVTYTWNKEQGGADDFGFIAEEIHEVLPQIAPKNPEGEIDGVEYGKITPYLVEAMKEQQEMIESQQKQMNTMQAEIERLSKLLMSK